VPRLEGLETRRLLATLGVDIRFLADDRGLPGAELQTAVLRGEPFWVDVRVQDIRQGASQGVIALPLNVSWDPARFEFDGDANLTATGSDPLPPLDRLVTPLFPLQRAVDAYDPAAGPFDPTAPPGDLLDLFNLRGVQGAALPNGGAGQAIGVGAAQPPFSQLRFLALANTAAAPLTVNLDGSMSFADADPLEAFLAIGNASDVQALANTVMATVPIAGGSISGTKFNDLDGDGTRDPSEPGVEGVTIVLTPTNPTGADISTTTLADGGYVFNDLAAGDYVVSEIVPSDSVLTTPGNNMHAVSLRQASPAAANLDFGNFRRVTLSGRKFNDLNENGVQDPGELGVPGVTIRLNLNSNANPADDLTQVTSVQGEYQFTGVNPGTHTISEDLPSGFRQTLPAGGGDYSVTATSGQDRTDLHFGNVAIVTTTTIAGTKFDDLDGDGTRDNGEPGRAGITIRLDLNNDGSLDREATTTSDGSFLFTDVPAGTHAVSEVLPAGSVRTVPQAASILVTVAVGNPATGLLFGNFQVTALGGVVFNDLDRDGVMETGETPQSGVTVQLDLNNEGSNDRTIQTDAQGRYQFDAVGPGTHAIRQVAPARFEPTVPQPPLRAIENRSGVSRTDLDFGNARIVVAGNNSIFGTVYSDANRNGQVDSGESGLAGVTVQLFVNGATAAVQSITTIADGSYSFTGLATGTYRIVQAQPQRYASASITLGTVLPGGATRGTTDGLNAFNGIVLGNQETAIDYNFGEVLTAVSKRMFLASLDVRAELTRNMGQLTAAIQGTAGDDQIRVEHLAGDRLRVTVNNQAPAEFSASQATTILIDGLEGQDSATILGNDQDESIRVSPSQVTLTTASQTLGVFNVPRIMVSGGGGNDAAVLRDSSGADQLTAIGSSAVLVSPNNQRIELVAIDSVQAISAVDAGPDQATVNAIDFNLRLIGDWI
jgi:hypothetical protein